MFTTVPNLQNPADTKAGRYVNADRSVSPIRDTGFRFTAGVPHIYNSPVKGPDAAFLPDYIHQDDIIDIGQATIRGEKVNAVRLINVNIEQHQAREAKYLQESIDARRKREKKENNDASKN